MSMTVSCARCLLLTAGLLANGWVAAQTAFTPLLKEAQWQAWLDSGKLAELERAAQARLASQADDAQAAVAVAMVVVEDNQTQRLDAMLPPLNACTARQPAQANCHYALGRIYGQQAVTASVFKMVGLAGKVKEQFTKALEIEPQLFEARQGLLQFYLVAPSVAGGSLGKARELAAAVQARQPEHAKLLRALIAAQEKNTAEMERELASIRVGDDKLLQRETRLAWMQLGTQWVNDKAFDKARPMFEQLQRDYPSYANGAYGLGRVATDTGRPDEAIKLLERARQLDGADRLPIDYRLGLAFMGKGDRREARLAFERFLGNKKANPRNLEDAKKRLAEIG